MIDGWTDARVELLKVYHAQNISYSQIARKINDETGASLTKGACIGRAHRMGLAKAAPREPGFRPGGECKPRKSRKSHAPKEQYVRVKLATGELAPLMPERVESPMPLEFRGIPFANLGKTHCRYPRGEPIVYCGQRKMEGSSYCPACHALCYTRRAA